MRNLFPSIARPKGWNTSPTGAEAAQLVRIAVPMAGVGLVNMGISITDTVMISWLGTSELAAGAVISDLSSIVFYMASGIFLALGPLLGEATGAKQPDRVRRIVRQGLIAALVVASPCAMAVWNTDVLMKVLGVPGDIIALGRGYAAMSAFSIAAMLIVAVWRNAFAALGQSHIFLIATVLALPLNAGLNGLFMFGVGPIPAYGLTGAGIATVIVTTSLALGLGLFASLAPAFRIYRIYVNFWRLDRTILAELFRVGLPIGFSSLAEYGVWLISTVIVSLFGTEALAAHAIALRMAGIAYAIPVSLSQAVSIRVGHALGRRDDAQLLRVVRSGFAVGIAGTSSTLLALAALHNVLPPIFLQGASIDNSQVHQLAATLLLFLAAVMGLDGPRAMAAGALRGLKDTRVPLYLAIVGYWLVGVPMGLVLGFTLGFGSAGIWSGILLGTGVCGVLLNIHLLPRIVAKHRSSLRQGYAS